MNRLIVKSNELIEAKYKLSLEEQRTVLYLVSLIEQNDEDFKKYNISIQVFSELANLTKGTQYSKFKKLSKSLISKTITIQEGKRTIIVSWIASSVYDSGTGIVSLSFAPELKPYLLQLKKSFTLYNLSNVLYLKSIYSIRIFELLKQYEKLSTRTFELDELKQIFCVDKLPAYKDYFNFKTKIIIPAHKELKEKCDIYFEFEEIKEGRRVAKIKFLIYQNEDKKKKPCDIAKKSTKKIVSVEPSPQEIDLTAELGFITEKLTDKELLSIWNAANGDAKLIHKRYDAVKRKKDVNNLVGFLLWSIQHPDENFDTIKSTGKNKFINYESRSVDFAEIERLEREKLMKEYEQSLEA